MLPSIDLARLLSNLSLALDFSQRGLLRHHQRVTLISLRLATAIGMPASQRLQLFQAAITHDIGAISWEEKSALEIFDLHNSWRHCQRGHRLITEAGFPSSVAELVLYHHDHWLGNNPSGKQGEEIPLGSRIIHLADRVEVLLSDHEHILHQSQSVVDSIGALSGKVFDPQLVETFRAVARCESFWLDLASPFLPEILLQLASDLKTKIEIPQVIPVARLFALAVDTRSPFTFYHSQRVAVTARLLSRQLGMSSEESLLMEAAGLLHDLGKLAVPGDILEKPGPLTREELDWIKAHPYYTYWLLQPLEEQLPLVRWAAHHHERLNGQGYPFRRSAEELCLGSRIMAVSDVFTALRENRPYRAAFSWEEALKTLREQARQGQLDPTVTEALMDSRRELEELWLAVENSRQKQ
ncbi:HD domain-containing phosphohydrolase [Desulfothermobacter acidiphilus]|uniref:HD domain-containing phosphohydrolase n=1 Tax=Desulfothermobacter acidiphilus TaxID=1938353 RepID=UPI003F8CEBB6